MLELTIDYHKKVTFSGERRLHLLWLYEILYCRAAENYSVIFLKNGESLTISQSIAKVEERINSLGFFRIHRSFLVNLSQVREYNFGSDQLILQDGASIPVARRRKQELLEKLSLDLRVHH
ncbi:MAG: LytR/AlgR family response regulator transcription factor [Marinifilaceae bacterium]